MTSGRPRAGEKVLGIGKLDPVDPARRRAAGSRQQPGQVERDHWPTPLAAGYCVVLRITTPVIAGPVSVLISPKNFCISLRSALAT